MKDVTSTVRLPPCTAQAGEHMIIQSCGKPSCPGSTLDAQPNEHTRAVTENAGHSSGQPCGGGAKVSEGMCTCQVQAPMNETMLG